MAVDPNDKDWNNRRTNEVADKEDLQNIRALQGDNNNWNDDDHDEDTDNPEIEFVAEEIIASGADHGALETIESGRAKRYYHHEYDPDDPGGELAEEQEECEITCFYIIERQGAGPGRKKAADANKRKNAENGDAGDRDTDPEVFISAGSKCSKPETLKKTVSLEIFFARN